MKEYALVLEGSTYAGSVALVRGRDVIAERTLADSGVPSRGGREEKVLPSVAECLSDAGIPASEVGAIVCGGGPGSFTSLRVAASIAKGIAFGVGCPMYAVPSLLLTVAAADVAPGKYLSVLSAMRDEWFAAFVDVVDDGSISLNGSTMIVKSRDLAEAAKTRDARIVGPSQEISAMPHARGAARLLDSILASGPIDLDTWEPDYGRLAEAQVRWEEAHARPLGAGA